MPIKKIKEEPKQPRIVETKRPVAKQTYREEYKKVEPTIQLEPYYYGILARESNNDSGVAVSFEAKVSFCRLWNHFNFANGWTVVKLNIFGLNNRIVYSVSFAKSTNILTST